MKRLIVSGDPGIRKDARIEHEGDEYTCFRVTRNGEWHGPDRVQLWCVIGSEDEREDYEHQNFIPHFLNTDHVTADDVSIVEPA